MEAASTPLSYISHPSSPMSPPYKKQRMTVTQTYRLAHTARGKLSTEASRGEYDLRILVGHANLLDNLMIDLNNVEQEQEAAYQSGSRPTTILFTEETIELPEVSDSEDEEEEEEEEGIEEDVDDDVSDYEDAEEVSIQTATPFKRTPSRSPAVVLIEDIVDDDEDYDEDYDNPELSLVRTQSRSDLRSQSQEHHGVPELVHDSDDSDDESLSPPLSPAQPTATYTNITIKDFAMKTHTPVAAAAEEALHDQGFWIPQQQSAMIAAC